MPAYVVLELATPSPHARGARATASPLAAAHVRQLLVAHEATLLSAAAPAPDAADPTPYTTLAVPDMARAVALADALRSVEGIAAVFAKPGESLP